MKYALLIYEPAPGAHEVVPKEQYEAMFAQYMAISNDSRYLSGTQLQPADTATTVRIQSGQTLTTDGPFANTKEVFGGYCMIEADNLDEAIELAARMPAASIGGSIEVRPVVER